MDDIISDAESVAADRERLAMAARQGRETGAFYDALIAGGIERTVAIHMTETYIEQLLMCDSCTEDDD